MSDVTIQLGLFGKASIAETHVVSAHTRQLADGSTVFVGEHLRWNQGSSRRAAPRRPRASADGPAPGQGSLFDPRE